MPRGGKRPGAGAPKGNFNGVRTGNHSARMLMVYLALVNYPEEGLKALGDDLYEQGFYEAAVQCRNQWGRMIAPDTERQQAIDRTNTRARMTIR